MSTAQTEPKNRGKYPVLLRSRVSQEQMEKIRKDAEMAGMTVCKYVRERAVGNTVKAKVDIKVLSGLNRIGGLLKHLHNNGQDTSEALAQITKAARYLQHHLKKHEQL